MCTLLRGGVTKAVGPRFLKIKKTHEIARSVSQVNSSTYNSLLSSMITRGEINSVRVRLSESGSESRGVHLRGERLSTGERVDVQLAALIDDHARRDLSLPPDPRNAGGKTVVEARDSH